MGINKIVYVTPGEDKLGDLSSTAESQLRKIAHVTLGGDIENSVKVFRATAESSALTGDTLLYLSSKCRKTSHDIGEHLYHNLLSNLDTIDSIIKSTRIGEIVVVGVTQTELKNVLDLLKGNGYDVIDKERIRHAYTIYAVSIDPNNKDSSFFEVHYGE